MIKSNVFSFEISTKMINRDDSLSVSARRHVLFLEQSDRVVRRYVAGVFYVYQTAIVLMHDLREIYYKVGFLTIKFPIYYVDRRSPWDENHSTF